MSRSGPGSSQGRIIGRVVGQRQLGQRRTPLHVSRTARQSACGVASTRRESFVALLLPLRRGGVAEKQAAAHRTAIVYAAQFSGLKRAALAGPAGRRIRWSHRHERGQFQCGHVEPMSPFLEPAAPPRDHAHRAALVIGRRCGRTASRTAATASSRNAARRTSTARVSMEPW